MPLLVRPRLEVTARRAVVTGYCFAAASFPPGADPFVVLGLRGIIPRVRGCIDSREGINCCNSGGTPGGNFGACAFGTPAGFGTGIAGAGSALAATAPPGDVCDSRA